MQRIVFADSWSAFFAEFNFKSFDDFYENLAVKTIGVNKNAMSSRSISARIRRKKSFS
ncbi:MAG: hypothetical protein ACYSTT_09200 [Planctomycetota bacterium]